MDRETGFRTKGLPSQLELFFNQPVMILKRITRLKHLNLQCKVDIELPFRRMTLEYLLAHILATGVTNES
jgi:hypothetical protein